MRGLLTEQFKHVAQQHIKTIYNKYSIASKYMLLGGTDALLLPIRWIDGENLER